MNKRTKSFLLSILTLSFIFYSCSNLANDLQKRKNQNLFNITIQETSNGTVTAAKSSGIKAGEEVILSVIATSGYELKTISVTNTQNKDVAVVAMEQGTFYKFTMPASDVTVGAAFDKTGPVDITEPGDLSGANGNTVYRIKHYQQNIDDANNYTLYAIQKKRGDAGKNTAADAKDYPGFTSLNFSQKIIDPDGSTVVEIYYIRNIITYTIELHGGNCEGSEYTVEVSGLYGTTVNKPNKVGYHLPESIPEVFGPEDTIYSVYWLPNTNTPYKVRIYLQNVEGGDNYTLGEEISKTGTTDTNTDYNASTKDGFNIQTYNQININADESTILSVYYNRKAYTVTFDTNGGNPMANQEILYQASPTQIPVRDGYTFYNWYTDREFCDVFDSNKGITWNMTLYAFWKDNSITYQFHENVERIEAGANGTLGTTGEYVLFGDYPQSLLTDSSIIIDKNKIMKIGSYRFINNEFYYGGSDGNLYYEYNSNYYKVEPIKWRVISRDENNIAVLLAERILDISAYGRSDDDYVYTNSLIHDFLNNDFLLKAFTVSAQYLINFKIIDSDTTRYYYNSQGEKVDEQHFDDYSKDKIYLLKYSEFQNLSFHEVRIHTGFSAVKYGYLPNLQEHSGWWWLRSSYFSTRYSWFARVVDDSGSFVESKHPDTLNGGVVPALSIYLPPAD